MAVNEESLSLQFFLNDSLQKTVALRTAFPFKRRNFIIDDYFLDPSGDYWYESRDNVLYKQRGTTLYDESPLLGKVKGDVVSMCFDKWRKTLIVSIFNQQYPC